MLNDEAMRQCHCDRQSTSQAARRNQNTAHARPQRFQQTPCRILLPMIGTRPLHLRTLHDFGMSACRRQRIQSTLQHKRASGWRSIQWQDASMLTTYTYIGSNFKAHGTLICYKSKLGNTCANVYTQGKFTRVIPMTSRKDARKSLINFTDGVGIPEWLITDGETKLTGRHTKFVKEAQRMCIMLHMTKQGRKN
jgi:hypothetical protein